MTLPSISSHRLRVIVECGHHPSLVVSLAKEVLAARRLHRLMGEWLNNLPKRKSRDERRGLNAGSPPLVQEIEVAYKALEEVRARFE